MPDNLITVLSSKTRDVTIRRGMRTVVVGERINPTGRKQMLAALQAGNFEQVKADALAQVAAGAQVLDINAGVPGADETQLLQQVMATVMDVTDAPLCIDTADSDALAGALSAYEGKALVNSVNGEASALERTLPLVKEHGAAVIGLCMDENGIPPTAEDRLRVAAKILDHAGRRGIPPEDVVIDPLALTMGSDSNAGKIALDTIALVVAEFGVNVTMGVSNISFGMPERKHINSTYIAMAILAGLTCPITNPMVPEVQLAILAADLSMGRDEYGMDWIKAYRQRQKASQDEPTGAQP